MTTTSGRRSLRHFHRRQPVACHPDHLYSTGVLDYFLQSLKHNIVVIDQHNSCVRRHLTYLLAKQCRALRSTRSCRHRVR